jgi:pyruvate/2-oxoglutarate dehydrogenase complex dihydrolipoamide dehydrogenase (E3) component
VNVGCIPKKLYVYASEYAAAWREAEGFGWRAEGVSFDWETLRDNKTKEIARLNAIYGRLLEAPGVEIIEGHGRLTGAQTVAVGDKTYRAEKILLATGTWPALPDIPGIELALTSNEIFDLPRFPERLLIIGGGYIATEFASIFSGLGANVVQSYRGDLFSEDLTMTFVNFSQRKCAKPAWICASITMSPRSNPVHRDRSLPISLTEKPYSTRCFVRPVVGLILGNWVSSIRRCRSQTADIWSSMNTFRLQNRVSMRWAI